MKSQGTTRIRRAILGMLAVLGVTAGILVAAAPAQAINNQCNVGTGIYGDACLYYQSNYRGAKAGIYYTVPDYASPALYFPGPGAGAGTRLWNNAGSGSNGDLICTARIWFSRNFGGPHVALAPYGLPGWAHPTLGSVNNDNRSQNWAC